MKAQLGKPDLIERERAWGKRDAHEGRDAFPKNPTGNVTGNIVSVHGKQIV